MVYTLYPTPARGHHHPETIMRYDTETRLAWYGYPNREGLKGRWFGSELGFQTWRKGNKYWTLVNPLDPDLQLPEGI